MNNHTIRAGVLGATGYTGRELVGLLDRHPRTVLELATSESEAGRRLRPAEPGGPARELVRVEEAALEGCDVVFSCLPHGEGGEWVSAARGAGVRVVDLSSDLRLPAVGAEARRPCTASRSCSGRSCGARIWWRTRGATRRRCWWGWRRCSGVAWWLARWW